LCTETEFLPRTVPTSTASHSVTAGHRRYNPAPCGFRLVSSESRLLLGGRSICALQATPVLYQRDMTTDRQIDRDREICLVWGRHSTAAACSSNRWQNDGHRITNERPNSRIFTPRQTRVSVNGLLSCTLNSSSTLFFTKLLLTALFYTDQNGAYTPCSEYTHFITVSQNKMFLILNIYVHVCLHFVTFCCFHSNNKLLLFVFQVEQYLNITFYTWTS